MEREVCLRCGGEMVHMGREQLQKGKPRVFMGDLDNLLSGALTVDIYCCRDCRKLEFYAVEDVSDEVECPVCHARYPRDAERCPKCLTRREK